MTAMAIDVVSALCVLTGVLFALIGGIGVLRLPDTFTRMHAASLTDTLAAGLVLLGLALQAGISLTSLKHGLILGFLIVTTPTATYALAQTALSGGMRPLGRRLAVRPPRAEVEATADDRSQADAPSHRDPAGGSQ